MVVSPDHVLATTLWLPLERNEVSKQEGENLSLLGILLGLGNYYSARNSHTKSFGQQCNPIDP